MENKETSQLIKLALQKCEKLTNSAIYLHLSRNPFQKDSTKRALEIFNAEKLTSSPQRNSILIFLNLKNKSYTILSDEGIHKKVGQKYWDHLSIQFKEDLLSTHYENALLILIYTLLDKLRKIYPK